MDTTLIYPEEFNQVPYLRLVHSLWIILISALSQIFAVALSKDCWTTETKYCEKELGLTKFERIYEFKSIIRHYSLEQRSREISKQETRRWCDITTRLVVLNVQRGTLAKNVRTYGEDSSCVRLPGGKRRPGCVGKYGPDSRRKMTSSANIDHHLWPWYHGSGTTYKQAMIEKNKNERKLKIYDNHKNMLVFYPKWRDLKSHKWLFADEMMTPPTS